MKNPQFYLVEITDTYGGEANYSWVKRYKVQASTMRGAAYKISRHTGAKWRKTGDFFDLLRYDSKTGATCFFVEDWQEGHSDKDYEII